MKNDSNIPSPAERVRTGLGSGEAAVLAGVLVGLVLFVSVATGLHDFDSFETALRMQGMGGRETFVRDQHVNGNRLTEELRHSFQTFTQDDNRLALWVSNSQVHGIADFRSDRGDNSTCYYANESARKRGARLNYMVMAFGFANMNDFLGTYLRFREAGCLPDSMIVAFTYANLGTVGIRQWVLDDLPPLDSDAVERWGPGIENLLQARRELKQGGDSKGNATAGTPQQRLERYLIGSLEGAWQPYADRNNVSHWSSLQARYRLEGLVSSVFRLVRGSQLRTIQSGSMPQETVAWNEKALDSLFRVTKEDGVPLVFYRIPHPQYGGLAYYDPEEYNAYFEDFADRCRREGAAYVDLHDIVPLEDFRVTQSQLLDVFHIKDHGHRVLGEAVDRFMAGLEAQPNALQ